MTSKVLSILILGGENSAEAYSGHSVRGGSRGYVPQLVGKLQQEGWQVHIECHAPVDIHVALPLLQRLNLNRFDLILLELGHTRLQQPASAGFSGYSPSYSHTQFDRIRSYGIVAALRLLAAIGQIGLLREIEAQLANLVYYLQPYRRRLVLLTPMPHPQPVTNWLRQRGQDLFVQYGRRHMIPVFDTTMVVGEGDEFFVDAYQGQLSPVAGDLLGQTLFEYIQTNALLPARPELRQRRGY